MNVAGARGGAWLRREGRNQATESVSKMLKVIDTLKPADNGKFLNYEDRREIPW